MLTHVEDAPLQPSCSVAKVEEALGVLEGRWKLLILFHLFTAPKMRFSALTRSIPSVTQKMLVQQLRDLEKDGVVLRVVYPEVPPKVEYSLTEAGRALKPSLEALMIWAQGR